MGTEAVDRGDAVSAEAAAAAAAAATAALADDGDKKVAGADAEAEAAATAEAEAAAKAETEAAAAAARDEKGRFIPKARFDEQLGKEREARVAAERALADLQAQLKTVDANADLEKVEKEIAELEVAHAKAIVDGDANVAAELAAQIRFKERTIQIAQQNDLSTRAKNEAREEVRMDMAIERLESTYPQLNQKNEEAFDQDLTDLVLGMQLQLINNERMAPSQALIEAARRVMAKFAPAADDKKEDDAKGLDAARKAADRKAAQVDKNLKTAKGQPASMKEAGMDSDKAGMKTDIDVANMTLEELNALPEATKQRLRGDML